MMVNVGVGTGGKKVHNVMIYLMFIMCFHTPNNNACCVCSRDVHSSLWDVESGCTGVLPSMTGMHGRQDDETTQALPAR